MSWQGYTDRITFFYSDIILFHPYTSSNLPQPTYSAKNNIGPITVPQGRYNNVKQKRAKLFMVYFLAALALQFLKTTL